MLGQKNYTKYDNLVFRKATPEDIPFITRIYDLIHDREERGETQIGWVRSIYPNAVTAAAAIEEGDMYVALSGETIVASGRLNKIQVPEYSLANWTITAPDEEVFVLHTLTVDPSLRHSGIGRSFVTYYNDLARYSGCKVLRIDTNEKNIVAREMYRNLGFREAGIVPCVFNGIKGVQLVCLERAVM